MIDALVVGKLYGSARQGRSKNDNLYTTANVRTNEGGESLFVNVITFSESAGRELMALEDGDSVALAGSLTPKVYQAKDGEWRPGLDLLAHRVTTTYHVRRKRREAQGEDAE